MISLYGVNSFNGYIEVEVEVVEINGTLHMQLEFKSYSTTTCQLSKQPDEKPWRSKYLCTLRHSIICSIVGIYG